MQRRGTEEASSNRSTAQHPGVVKICLFALLGLFWIAGLNKSALVVPCGHEEGAPYDPTFDALYSPASTQKPSYKKDGLCALAAEQLGPNALVSGASTWWTQHVTTILAASQNSNDPQFLHKEWMSDLLATLTPEMLQKGVRSRPSAASIQKLFRLVHQRFLNPNATKPIQVVVLGGSVTRGHGCGKLPAPVEGYKAKGESLEVCAWSHRLQVLINDLAGVELVRISNLAVGGTSLEVAIPIVKYLLYPTELLPGGPDVIITAYHTNEQYVANHWDTTRSVDYADAERERFQEFIQSVYHSHTCDNPPMLFFLDDYLGNFQYRIMGETQVTKLVTELAEWYGDIMHVSYADVVRRSVYADVDRALFSGSWPIVKGVPREDVHFGMGGHMSIAWVFLYSLVDSFASFCQNEAFFEEIPEVQRHSLINEDTWKRMYEVHPPPLTKETTLMDITRDWKQLESDSKANREASCADRDAQKDAPCVFAFIAGPAGTVRNTRHMRNYINPFARERIGWQPVEDYGAGGFAKKLGFVATQPEATFTLQLEKVTKEVRVINLHSLKSYGEKWANSTARFTVTVENPGEEARTEFFDVEGFHNTTSR